MKEHCTESSSKEKGQGEEHTCEHLEGVSLGEVGAETGLFQLQKVAYFLQRGEGKGEEGGGGRGRRRKEEVR